MVVPASGRRRARFTLAQLRKLIASLPAAIAYLAGPDLVVEFTNDTYQALIGDRDITGLPLRQALPELAAQGRFEVLDQILRTGQTASGNATEVWVGRPGRQPEQLFADYVYQPVHAPDGGVAGILLYATDVTGHVRDRLRLEALASELAESEERYRALFETLPQGAIHYRADGSVTEANPAAHEMLGVDAFTTWLLTPGQAVSEDGSPYQAEDLPVREALRTGQVVADALVGIPHRQTGEQRWLKVTAVPSALDGLGRPQRAYALLTDVTEQRRIAAQLTESATLLGHLRETNVLGVVSSSEHGIYDANDAFLDLIGCTRADLAAGRISYSSITAPEWAGRDRRALAELRRNGSCQPYDKEYVHRDGHRVPVVVGGAVTGRDPLRWVTFVVDLTARQRAEQERASLLARERIARVEADQAQERLSFLLRASALVAAARDRHELLDQVAPLMVPSLADYCVVFLPAGEGMLLASAIAHRDPDRADIMAGLRSLPIPVSGPLLPQAAYLGGTTTIVPDGGGRMPGSTETERAVMKIVYQAGPNSALGTPLLADPHRLGVIVLGRGEDRPRFGDGDAEVIEELARRLAIGLVNADTSAREHTIAETLQRATLPGVLPEISGLDLAARYFPATGGADVGGDWYDAFTLDGGRAGLVIGDVTGHNIGSASIMGQVRSMLRAYAVDHSDPREVLRRTNGSLARLLPEALATAVYAVLDPATGEFSYANAGHPPPLLTSEAGTAYLEDAAGVMLGACPDIELVAGWRRLPPGGGLLLYTDGLIEDRSRDLGQGLVALAGAVRRARPGTARQLCMAAQQLLAGGTERADDVCLLSVHRRA